jgi:hypothetical protein
MLMFNRDEKSDPKKVENTTTRLGLEGKTRQKDKTKEALIIRTKVRFESEKEMEVA